MDSKNEDLKWKVIKQKPGGVVPSIPKELLVEEEGENFFKAAMSRSLKNPFVPVGLVATCSCLVGMIIATKKRELLKAQYYMRGRIAAQAFTIVALVVGGLHTLNWDLSVFFKRKLNVPNLFGEGDQSKPSV
uniref:HIG1 domain-containing protein n=1 Tax=Strongyloides stercoralis TaxID=6248 RepID=A0A0K0ERX3_STRER